MHLKLVLACPSKLLKQYTMTTYAPLHLNQVVEVVFPPYPAVVGLETVRFVGDVFSVQALTVVELPFKQLEREKRQGKKESRRFSTISYHREQ